MIFGEIKQLEMFICLDFDMTDGVLCLDFDMTDGVLCLDFDMTDGVLFKLETEDVTFWRNIYEISASNAISLKSVLSRNHAPNFQYIRHGELVQKIAWEPRYLRMIESKLLHRVDQLLFVRFEGWI